MKTITQTIGNTPLFYLSSVSANDAHVYAKHEGFNPSGSIKDRVAHYLIEKAEEECYLRKGMTIIEATSGNAGISFAMIGGIRGYRVIVVMSDGVSKERRQLIRGYGATLILTPGRLGTHGAIKKAEELAGSKPEKYWFARQFENTNNALVHYNQTALELIKEFQKIDYFVSGVGTGGSISGIGKKLKETYPHVKIVAVVPPPGYGIQGIQNPNHDFRGPVFDDTIVDEKILVSIESAYEETRGIMKNEGFFVGMSSGANIAAIKNMVSKGIKGAIVTLFPDRGDKYLSTPLFNP